MKINPPVFLLQGGTQGLNLQSSSTDKFLFEKMVLGRDMNGLYDLQEDPNERYNLIEVPHFQDLRKEMRNRLFDKMESAPSLQLAG